MPRTTHDLISERGALVHEQRFERDATARAVLQFQIDEIDREVASRLGKEGR